MGEVANLPKNRSQLHRLASFLVDLESVTAMVTSLAWVATLMCPLKKWTDAVSQENKFLHRGSCLVVPPNECM